MPTYTKIGKCNLFKNDDRWQGGVPQERGAPPWSNGKFTVDQPLQPGVQYKMSAWQYSDTGNLSIDIQLVEDDSNGFN